MFWRRERPKFFHPDSALRDTLGAASAMAADRNLERSNGTDSLDLLVAATASRPIMALMQKMKVDPHVVAARARSTQVPSLDPGMTEDARRVMEVTMARALRSRREPTAIDLLVALATTPGPARSVLEDAGVDGARLTPFVE